MVVWAKNKQGWLDLNKLVNKTNDVDYFYHKPRISLHNVFNDDVLVPGLEHFLTGNIQGFSGHQGSHLSDNLFCDLTGQSEDSQPILEKHTLSQRLRILNIIVNF
jgi:hypothetical protein